MLSMNSYIDIDTLSLSFFISVKFDLEQQQKHLCEFFDEQDKENGKTEEQSF